MDEGNGMNDYISRQAAIHEIMGQPPEAHYPFWYAAQIEQMPPADVRENVHRRWINHRNDNGHNIADCSECGEAMQWFDDDIKPNFCPNCGAKMDAQGEE